MIEAEESKVGLVSEVNMADLAEQWTSSSLVANIIFATNEEQNEE